MGQTKLSKRQIAGGLDGWIPAEETWTYASADAPTFTFTVAADVTAKYSAGMRVKYTQTTVKYGIITAVSAFSGGNTTITIYGGTDYTMTDATISLNYFSMVKAPQGFPMSPVKWQVVATPTNYSRTTSVVSGTIYNAGSIDIPIGVWDFNLRCKPYAGYYQSTWRVAARIGVGVSTANNSFSVHSVETGYGLADVQTSSYYAWTYEYYTFEQFFELTSKTTYYLNVSMPNSLGDPTTNRALYCHDMRLVATCAYL